MTRVRNLHTFAPPLLTPPPHPGTAVLPILVPSDRYSPVGVSVTLLSQ